MVGIYDEIYFFQKIVHRSWGLGKGRKLHSLFKKSLSVGSQVCLKESLGIWSLPILRSKGSTYTLPFVYEGYLWDIRCPPNGLGNFLGYFNEGEDLREGPPSYKSILQKLHVRSKFVGLFFSISQRRSWALVSLSFWGIIKFPDCLPKWQYIYIVGLPIDR
jgi:hypothetical protein